VFTNRLDLQPLLLARRGYRWTLAFFGTAGKHETVTATHMDAPCVVAAEGTLCGSDG